MRFSFVIGALLAFNLACGAEESGPRFEQGLDLLVEERPWLRTITTPHDHDDRHDTYKVFTHLYDFEGAHAITKGPGGRFTHHRGLFIGWNHTHVGDARYDLWHMRDGYQQFEEWTALERDGDRATKTARITWRNLDDETLIEELRTISARPGEDGARIIDFKSTLTATKGDIQLRGDSHHAGMQVRMSNEVVDHEDTTEFILPGGAERLPNEEVGEAWWVCGNFLVGGKRYWVLHMTDPNIDTGGTMLYSTRAYGRFGSFIEPDLSKDEPKTFRFRVVLSETELDQAACQALFEAYAGEL